jgi:NAD(P)-dependent dehydrogenase (short-subunit alcohol dehydrogenase family)
MAAELRDKKISVNCVLPTILDTPDNRAAMPKSDPQASWSTRMA